MRGHGKRYRLASCNASNECDGEKTTRFGKTNLNWRGFGKDRTWKQEANFREPQTVGNVNQQRAGESNSRLAPICGGFARRQFPESVSKPNICSLFKHRQPPWPGAFEGSRNLRLFPKKSADCGFCKLGFALRLRNKPENLANETFYTTDYCKKLCDTADRRNFLNIGVKNGS